jgi:hypothetical protein
LITIRSRYAVRETIERLAAAATAWGPSVFARIGHGANAGDGELVPQLGANALSRQPARRSTHALLFGGAALVVVSLHFATNATLGFHTDELYYGGSLDRGSDRKSGEKRAGSAGPPVRAARLATRDVSSAAPLAQSTCSKRWS